MKPAGHRWVYCQMPPTCNPESTCVSGDLLAFFTDGVSEAMNSAEEEWGESNLIEVLRAVRCNEPSEIARATFAAADDFAGGATRR